MILLDTNVISEPLRPAPNPAVIAWLDAQQAEALFLSTVTLAELHSRQMRVASRDTAPYIAAGVPVINPWKKP